MKLVSEVDRIASQAQFNGMNMLTGAFAKDSAAGRIMQFQIGANVDQNERVYIGTMTAQALGLKGSQGSEEQLGIENPDKANMAIATIDNALLTVSKQRVDLGGRRIIKKGRRVSNCQHRNLLIYTDMASEMVEYTKNQILTQSGTAMLAQANSQSQNVLALLR